MKARDHPLALQILQVLRPVTCLLPYVVAITISILKKILVRCKGKIRISIAEVVIIETITIAGKSLAINFAFCVNRRKKEQIFIIYRFVEIVIDLEEEAVVAIVTIFQIIVDATTIIIKTVNISRLGNILRLYFFLNKFLIDIVGGDNYEKRGGDDWGRGGSSRGGFRDGTGSDPPVRTNDRWQEPDKRENSNYGGKWKEERGGNSRGKYTQ